MSNNQIVDMIMKFILNIIIHLWCIVATIYHDMHLLFFILQ